MPAGQQLRMDLLSPGLSTKYISILPIRTMEHINLFYVISLCMYNLIVYTGRKFRAHPPIPLSMLLVFLGRAYLEPDVETLKGGHSHLAINSSRERLHYNTQVTLIHI